MKLNTVSHIAHKYRHASQVFISASSPSLDKQAHFILNLIIN